MSMTTRDANISRRWQDCGASPSASARTGWWKRRHGRWPSFPTTTPTCPHHYRFAVEGETEEAFADRLAVELEATILAEDPETVAAFIPWSKHSRRTDPISPSAKP